MEISLHHLCRIFAYLKEFEQWKREAKDKVNKMEKGKLKEDEVYNWLIEN